MYTSYFRTGTTLVLLILAWTQLLSQGSLTWGATQSLTTGNYGNLHPRITLDGFGYPIVMWGRSSDESLFLSRWNGTSFTMPVLVNQSFTIAVLPWMGPSIASRGDTVFIAVKRTPESDSTNHIYLYRSLDGGVTFGTPMRVDYIADSISRFPEVTVGMDGNPLVGFMKFDPGFGNARWVVTKSSDLGLSYNSDVLASGWSGGTVCDCCPGALVTGPNGTFAMLYRDNLNNIRDIWAGISSDFGANFDQGMPIDQSNTMLMNCPSSGPDGVIVGDTLLSVFMNPSAVYWSKASISTAQGATGSTISPPTSGITQQNFPRIAHHNDAVAVVWRQNANTMAQLPILFTNNLASGFPSSYELVAEGANTSVVNMDVAVSEDAVHVVWQDNASGTVKYRKGTYLPFVATAETHNSMQVTLGPNPAIKATAVRLHASSPELPTAYQVIDLSGRQLVQGGWVAGSSDTLLSTADWAPGIYDIIVRFPSGIHSLKLVVLAE